MDQNIVSKYKRSDHQIKLTIFFIKTVVYHCIAIAFALYIIQNNNECFYSK